MAVITAQTPKKKAPLIKRVLPRTLFGRSLLIIVTPLVLVQVIATWIFYDRHYDTITKRLAQGLAGDVAAVITLLSRSDSPMEQRRIFQMARVTMQLELTFTPEAKLLVPEKQEFRGVVETRLDDALRERLRQPFVMDARSIEERVEILVQATS